MSYFCFQTKKRLSQKSSIITYKMSQNEQNPNLDSVGNALNIPDSHNMTSTIEPTHATKQETGIIESKTNYTLETQNQSKVSNVDQEGNVVSQEGGLQVAGSGVTGTAQGKEIVQEILKIEPIKKQEISVQAGGNKSGEVLKNIEETYAPESCQIHNPNQVKKQNQPYQSKQQGENGSANNDRSGPRPQVQIQVGVSLLDEPEKVISKAKQQRILSDHQAFSTFLQTQKTVSQNQKSVYIHIYQSVQRKRSQVVVWHEVLKQHFTQYAGVMKEFYQKCDKAPKQEKVQQVNKYLNIGEELKGGYLELVGFKESSGQNFKGMYEYVYTKIIKDLEKSRNNYVQQMGNAQSETNNKRKVCQKLDDQLRKQGAKVLKMFNRTKQGKKQQDDFFVQISKTIILEREFRQALVQWGKQIIELRKALLLHTETYSTDLQLILNTFKTQSNTLYGIQKIKYDRVGSTKKEIQEDNSYRNLVVLVDADYIKYSLESSLKKQAPQITDKNFDQFVQLPHFKILLGQPRNLLTNMKVKTFNLKDTTQQLINTVSGNLVLYNKDTLEHSEKMAVRHIKGATTMEQGAIEIQERVPGIIFNSKKKITIEFKDPDRAEELVCFIAQGDTNNVDA